MKRFIYVLSAMLCILLGQLNAEELKVPEARFTMEIPDNCKIRSKQVEGTLLNLEFLFDGTNDKVFLITMYAGEKSTYYFDAAEKIDTLFYKLNNCISEEKSIFSNRIVKKYKSTEDISEPDITTTTIYAGDFVYTFLEYYPENPEYTHALVDNFYSSHERNWRTYVKRMIPWAPLSTVIFLLLNTFLVIGSVLLMINVASYVDQKTNFFVGVLVFLLGMLITFSIIFFDITLDFFSGYIGFGKYLLSILLESFMMILESCAD